jgi:preprotein translocase subunit SecD
MRLVDAGPFPDQNAARDNFSGTIPDHLELLPDPQFRYYAVERSAPVTGIDLKDAFVSRDENGRPAVGFTFTADGAQRFGRLTEENIGKELGVVLDGRLQSVAVIESRITSSGIIRGGGSGFALKEADDLVLVLRSGALPASIQYLGEEIIGPSLGADSIQRGVVAAASALLLVIVFMLAYYRWAGANAIAAMLLNVAILLGSMAYFRAVLTLPGIAGVILTIGVGIDSNVLIFERIREEIREGRTAPAAVTMGFKRVFVTLIDTHLAALISAAFLFVFGTGPVKGFAVTLVIGLASNMFTSVFVSRTIFEWTLSRNVRGEGLSI